MKKVIFTLIMVLSAVAGMSQTIGEAFYVYRNDGEFNAFLREEVDSITYSYYDADSLYYGEIVTQIVYTTDSTYWIPLASIDSISFVTPETKYTPQVVKLEPLLPYIVSVDGMKLTFSSDTPSNLFPKTDEILVLDNFVHEQFPTGFAGKMSLRAGMQITCDSVSFEDIYEQLICYGYYTAINDSNSTENSRVRLIAKKKVGGHVSTSISLTGTLGSKETGLYVAADGSLGLDLRFTFKYRKDEPTYFDISLTPQLSFGLEAGAEGTISKTFEDEEPLFWMPIPDIPFYLKIKGGPISEFSLKASVVARTEAKFGYKFGIRYENEKFQWDGGNTSKWFSKPDVTGSINGSIFAGFKMSYGIYSYGDIISTAIENKAGIEFEANITDSIKKTDSFRYDELKKNYLDVNLKASAALKAEAKLFRWLKLSAKHDIFSIKFNVFKFRLVPSFTKPIVTLDKTSAYVSVIPDDHLLFSVLLGLGLWDDNNSLLNVQYCDTPYTDRKSWQLGEFSTSFTNLSLNKEYTVRPLVKLFGATIVAPPEESFKIAVCPITLDVLDVEESSAKAYGKIEGLEYLDNNVQYGIGYTTYNNPTYLIPAMDYYGGGVFSVNLSLAPNTTYEYFAYIIVDGKRYDGEKIEFTTKKHIGPYYVWDNANKSATFYYDDQCAERGGSAFTHLPYGWDYTVEKVIFDSSFSNFYPSKFTFIGYSKLESIENLHYLNVDSITDMQNMFYECRSLKSIDLSHFSTAHVKNMGRMFYRCSSLTSLDLSNFNTHNVNDMRDMFNGCSSLVSLNVQNFNTANVTTMTNMFCGCSSLTSLDLSNFTVNNGSAIHGMFQDCSSLITIYARDWNTGDSYCSPAPFSGCPNLKGGQGTKVGQNFYGYDENGNPLYYTCESYRTIFARIDGGKDKPGLFTAKE